MSERSTGTVVDPGVRIFLGLLAAVRWPPMHRRTVAQARDDFRLLSAATGTWTAVRSVCDTRVSTSRGHIPVRVYRPAATTGRRPLVVWYHGGGFVVGDLFTADGVCRRLARAACATVISVHYRRAPEHPLPAAHRDACAAARWALAHAGQLGADPARLVLAGDSAGGGLAAHVAQRLRDEGPAPAALQVLCYPASDFSLARADRDAAHARLLDWETIEWFAAHSMPGWSDSQRRDPSISPLYADRLSGLPPALVITAGVDPFRSDGIAYCRALSEAGVSAIHRDFPGQIHGFAGMDLIFPAAGDALRQAADAIARVRPVDARTAVSAVPEPILWDRVVTDRLRRMGDTAQRLPQVNGARVLATLADHHARAALATLVSLSRHGSPRAPDSQRTIP